MELCRLISECICTKCCADVRPFFSVSDLEFDLLISSNFANNKFIPNCYSINDDYFSPQRISKLVCNDYLTEIIGIYETKLNVNTCLNLNIPFYDFFSP